MLVDIHHEHVDQNPMNERRLNGNHCFHILQLTIFDNVKRKMGEYPEFSRRIHLHHNNHVIH
jgi:hypothetical protein